MIKNGLLMLLKLFHYLLRVFPINNKKIIFSNFNGRGYGDDPKYICEELLRNDSNYKVYWLVSNKNISIENKKVKKVKFPSLGALFHLATAKVWVNNVRFPLWVEKRKKQFYVQTWHGGFSLKKIEEDAADQLDDYYIKTAQHDSKMIDLITSGSLEQTEIYRTGFWYYGDILEKGLPRNDLFFNQTKKEELNQKIREKYHINKNKKIILYAPTFRTDKNYDYYDIDFDAIIKGLNNKTNQYIFLVKLHPGLKGVAKQGNNYIDVSDYPDVEEILILADILITDYSSIMFSFLLTSNKIYLYAKDLEDYLEKERGLYREYTSLPFPIAYTKSELVEKIVNNSYTKNSDRIKQFMEEAKFYDQGTASKEVCEIIRTRIKDKK